MDLRQLRYFAKVVECGSFSKAANQLGVAQPALSQHVRHMEEELGILLLHRGAHGVTATEAGERLHRHAKRILAEFAAIPDSVRGEGMAPRGEVRFGLPGTVSELLAAPLIEAARTLYPDVRIRIVEAMSGYILQWLRHGDVELAMIYSNSNPQGLAVHHGLSEEICLFANPELARAVTPERDEVSFAQAAELPLVVPGPGHGLRVLDEVAQSVSGTRHDERHEIDSYGQIKKLVERGLGFGILPRMAVQTRAQAGEFRTWRITDPTITRNVYLAYSTDRPLLSAPRAVGQLAWSILRGLVRDGTWSASLSEEKEDPRLF